MFQRYFRPYARKMLLINWIVEKSVMGPSTCFSRATSSANSPYDICGGSYT